ncbi:lectin subunit alpha-like isoform 2-T2 [Cochliomyia hominivorax]
MKGAVCTLILIHLVACMPQQKWHQSNDGSKFYIETTKMYNWFEAISECARKNMSLIAIDTFEKHQQIDSLLRRLYDKFNDVWIGGHENALAYRYEWITTGETFTFTNWGPGQPNESEYGKHCFLMSSDFQWYDQNCTSNKIGFICEEHPLVKRMCQRSSISSGRNMNDGRIILFNFANYNNMN